MDVALRRRYEGLVRVGYFGPNATDPNASLGWSAVNTVASQALARRSAAESMVLIKKDGTLPLSMPNCTRAALIGPYANATWQLLGSYFGVPPYYHSPLYAAKQLGLKTFYASGPSASNATTGHWTAQIEAAKEADVVLFFGGSDVSTSSELNDRASIAWPAAQLALIERLCALGKPCVVVQVGDLLDDTPLLQNPDVSAILWTAYPGQDGGPAIFDVLTGLVPPAGRLPVTQYPARYMDQIPMTDMTLRSRGNKPGKTYWFYQDAVLPFGYGLHYSNFSTAFSRKASHNNSLSQSPTLGTYRITDLLADCNTSYLNLCPLPPIAVEVTNTGWRTSDFVVLGLVASKNGPPLYPIKQLAAYTRVKNIVPQETRSTTLSLTLGDLARVTDRGDRVLYPGRHEILIDVPTQSTAILELQGVEAVLDVWPQP